MENPNILRHQGTLFSYQKKLTLIFILTFYLSGCIGLSPRSDGDWIGHNYRGPFEGRIVDADTKQPMENVVVFVNWRKRSLSHSSLFFDTKEILTDKNGYFYIPKKWSWNPWTNAMLDAHIVIFKAGYGHISGKLWPNLEKRALVAKNRPPEMRKRMGPSSYYDIEFEGELPVFLLKKLSTEEEKKKNLLGTNTGASVPHQKKILLMKEINKERRSLGLGEVTD